MNDSPYRTQGMVDAKHLLDEIESLKKENEELKRVREIMMKDDAKIWSRTLQENDLLKKENNCLQEKNNSLQEEVKKIKESPLENYKEVKVIGFKNDKYNPFFSDRSEDCKNPNAKPQEGSTSHVLSEHLKYGWEIKHVDLQAERFLLERKKL